MPPLKNQILLHLTMKRYLSVSAAALALLSIPATAASHANRGIQTLSVPGNGFIIELEPEVSAKKLYVNIVIDIAEPAVAPHEGCPANMQLLTGILGVLTPILSFIKEPGMLWITR